jgi:RNA polymerase sigma factor for flagellar operon FliA
MDANNKTTRPHFTARKAARKSCAANRAADRQRASRDALIEEYTPLVERLARKVFFQVNQRVEMDELIGWGYTGLIQAADRYVPGGAATFKTFAYYRIRGAMLDGIGQIAPLSRSGYRMAKAADDRLAMFPVELPCEGPLDENSLSSADEQLESRQLQDLVREAVDKLPARERQLILAHYWGEETLLDAGRDLGISKSWASRTHARALLKLRRYVDAAA